MHVIPYPIRRNLLNYLALASALGAGLVLGMMIPALRNQSLYRLIMLLAGACIGMGAVISGDSQRILLIFLVLSIPLNLPFSPIGKVPQHEGGARPGILIYLYDLPLLGLVALWLHDILLKREPIHLTALDGFALIFIVWSTLTLYKTPDTTLTGFEALRMVKLYLLAHVVAAGIKSTSILWDVLLAFAVALLMQTAFAVLQYYAGFDLGGLGFTVSDVRRVSGTVGWPNTFGSYIVVALCFFLALWICQAGDKWQPLLFGLSITGSIPLILSFSRGAWVSSGVAILLIFVLAGYASRLTARGIFKLGLMVAIALVVSLLFASQIQARAARDTLTVREELNELAFNMIRANPITGTGLNTFVLVMKDYDTTGVSFYFPQPVHNAFLLIAAETGVVGLVSFVLVVVAAFQQGWPVLKSHHQLLAVVMIAAFSGLAAILVSNLADVHLRTDVLYSLFWFLIGLIVGLRRLHSLESPTSSSTLHARGS